MRARTAALVFGAAAAAGAAVVGSTAAALFGARADERHRRTYQAMSQVFFTAPRYWEPDEESPEGQRPELVLVKGGPRN